MYKIFALILLVVCLNCVQQSHGYFITVDAHSEECFFDRAESGTKLGNDEGALTFVRSGF